MSRDTLQPVIVKCRLGPNIAKLIALAIGIQIHHKPNRNERYPVRFVTLSGAIVGTYTCKIPVITHRHLARIISYCIEFPADAKGYTLRVIDLEGQIAPIIIDSLGTFDEYNERCTIKLEYDRNIDLRTIREIMIVYVNYQPDTYPRPQDEYTLMDLPGNYHIRNNEIYSRSYLHIINDEFNMLLIKELFGSEIESISRNSLNTGELVSRDVQKILGQLYMHLPNRYGSKTTVNGKILSDVIEYVRKKICRRYTLGKNYEKGIYTLKRLGIIRREYNELINEIASLPGVGPVSYHFVVDITHYPKPSLHT
jgi:hypothetical protein